MNHSEIINKLSGNLTTFESLLKDTGKEEYLWRPSDEKWCLLEIVCHLYDEELHDFRARVKHTLEKTEGDPPKSDPVGWVKSNKYAEQDFNEMLAEFLKERQRSVDWLSSLTDLGWKNVYIHPRFGAMSAEFFLVNWLAHDYLHFRQITALKYNYIKSLTDADLRYAGDW